ncbi:sulfatase-like hydrolase/transferase [Dermabacteraceae bacterium CCM 9519]
MSQQRGASRPNIVVMMTDDQGHWAMPHRMPELVMPNLEELLGDALELEQFFCASPVCSPARASLLTGRTPSAHGVHDWLANGKNPRGHEDHPLEAQPSTPEVLAREGYQCALSGKWHIGHSREKAPGFEYWYAHREGGGPYFDAPVWAEDGSEAQEPRYLTHAITEQALDFLRERDADRPFYLQVNYTAPHTPWEPEHHPAKYRDLYRGCDFPSVPREEEHPWSKPRHLDFEESFIDPVPSLVGYCAALSAVDEGLGQIRQELERQGVWDETVFVYMADNGFACGHHGIWGKGNGSYPLNFWDSSVRVPFVIRVPGGARGVSSALVSATSLHPTLCELAGTVADPDRYAAGRSLRDLVSGRAQPTDEMVVVHSEYGGGRMITDGAWKLVHRYRGPGELYNLEEDPGEKENLYDEPAYAQTRQRLLDGLEEWFSAHERGEMSAFKRPVSGFGQVYAISRGYSDEETYRPLREEYRHLQ